MHAYTPWSRLLLGRNGIDHLLFKPDTMFLTGLFVIPFFWSHVINPWLRLLFVAFNLAAVHMTWAMRIEAALYHNLTPNDKTVSTNMPTLFTHLRQLEAAGGLIRFHVLQTPKQPASANHAGLPSNLALMHAMKQHSMIMANLQARLLDAYERCCRQMWMLMGGEMVPLATLKAALSDPLSTQAYLGVIEMFMANGIQHMPKPKFYI